MISQRFLRRSLLGTTCLLAACGGGGQTSGGELSPTEGQFISNDETTGRLELSVDSSSLGIGETTGFRAFVYDAMSRPVANIRVICDSEEGIAMLEPTTGSELTGAGGAVSGIIGCTKPGSYQFGCRLPVGANKRKFIGIRCAGEVPDGFAGFPGASGGNVGGGAVVPTEPSTNVRITDVVAVNSSGAATGSIDVTRTTCPSGVEPFSDDRLGVALRNSSNTVVRISRAQVIVEGGARDGSDLESQLLVVTAEVEAGETATLTLPLLRVDGAGKTVDGSADVSQGIKSVIVVLFGETLDGTEVELEAGTSITFAETDNCPAETD